MLAVSISPNFDNGNKVVSFAFRQFQDNLMY